MARKRRRIRERARQASSKVSYHKSAQHYSITVVGGENLQKDPLFQKKSLRQNQQPTRLRVLTPVSLASIKDISDQAPTSTSLIKLEAVERPASPPTSQVLRVEVPVAQKTVKHLADATSVYGPLSSQVPRSCKKGSQKDSQGEQCVCASNPEKRTTGPKRRSHLDWEETSAQERRRRECCDKSADGKLYVKSEQVKVAGTAKTILPQTNISHREDVKNHIVNETDVSSLKSSDTGVENKSECATTVTGKDTAAGTSGKTDFTAENERLQVVLKLEKGGVSVKETISETSSNVPSSEEVADLKTDKSANSEKVLVKTRDFGTVVRDKVACTFQDNSQGLEMNRKSYIKSTGAGTGSNTNSDNTVTGNLTKSSSSSSESLSKSSGTPAGSNITNSSASPGSISNNSIIKRVANVAVSKTSAKPNIANRMLEPSKKQVQPSNTGTVATTSTNTPSVSNDKNTGNMSGRTNDNTDAGEKSNDERTASIDDLLRQEDEDGPWMSEAIRKQIKIRNGAYKLYLKKRDDQLLNYYLRLKERIKKMITEAKEKQLAGRVVKELIDKQLRIVLIFDDQDSSFQSSKFPFVTNIFVKNFDLNSGHTSVEGLIPPNQNALFVVLCGIRTVIKLSVESECRKEGCSPRLYRVSPTPTDSVSILKELVSGALLFRKRVTEGKSRHNVVFSGLVLPSVYHIDKYAVDSHYTHCNHKAPLHSMEYFAALNLVLSDALRDYNTWAKQDASVQGFPGWDLQRVVASFRHEQDGFTLIPACQEARKKALMDVIEHTQTRILLVPRGQEITRNSKELKFIPTAITLVFDETEDFLANIKYQRLFHRNTSYAHIRYQDVHLKLRFPRNAEEKMLYVLFGGIETVLNFREDLDCKSFNCHSPLKRIEPCIYTDKLLGISLISCALSLRKEIESVNNCKVIFSTLLPIDLKAVDEHAVKEHLRKCKHQARSRPKALLEKDSTNLALAVKAFNTWARSDAHIQGFHDWNVQELIADITVGSEVLFLPDTQVDGRSLTRKWQSLKTEVVTTSVKKTFDFIDQINEETKVETLKSQPPAQKSTAKVPTTQVPTQKSTAKVPMTQKSIAKVPMTQKSTAKVPTTQVPAQRSTAKVPTTQVPAQKSTAKVPTTQVPAQKSTAKVPTTQVPAQKSTAQAPTTQVPVQKSTAQAPTTQVPAQKSTAQARTTQVSVQKSTAQAPTTQVPALKSTAQAPTTQVPAQKSTAQAPTTQVPAQKSTAQVPTTQVPSQKSTAQVPTTQVPAQKSTSQVPTTQVPNSGPSCSNAENKKFDHVVIIGNTLYWHILQDFKSSRVTTIGAEQLSFCLIPKLIRQHLNEKNRKALWLLPIGIYSLTEFHLHPSCQNCPCPLHEITLERNIMPTMDDLVKFTKDLLHHGKTLYQNVQEELGPDAVVLFVPPIRAVVAVKEMIKPHKLLHQVCERNNAFCADAETVNMLREYYNHFCELWKALVPEELNSTLPSLSVITKYQIDNQGQNLVPIVDGEDYTYAVEIWKDMMREFIAESLCCFQMDRTSISMASDKEKMYQDHRGTSTDGTKIMHILCVGSKSLCDNFASLQKQIPITFAHVNVDFSDECGKKCISYREKVPQSTAWVFLVDISLLTKKKSHDTHCSRANCRNPMEYQVIKENIKGTIKQQEILIESMIDKILANAKFFAINLVANLPGGSFICFLPVATTCATVILPNTAHDRIHELKRVVSNVQVLQGQYACWYKCATYFDKIWKQFLLENSYGYVIHELLVKYYEKKLEFIALENKLDYLRVKSRNAAQWSNTIEEIILRISMEGCTLRSNQKSQEDSIFTAIDDSPNSSSGLVAQDPAVSNLTGAPSVVALSSTGAKTLQAKVQNKRTNPLPCSSSNVSVTNSSEKENIPTKEKPSNSPSPNVISPNTPVIATKNLSPNSPLCTSVNSALLDKTVAKSINHPKNSSNTKLSKANPVPHSTSNASVTSSSEKANKPTVEKPSDSSSPKDLSPNTQVNESSLGRNTNSSPLNACSSVNSALLDRTTSAKNIDPPKNSSNTNSLKKTNHDPHSTTNVSVPTSLEKANGSTKEKPSGSSSPKVLTPNTPVIENCVKREIDNSPLNAFTSVNSTQLDRTSAAKSINPPKNSSNTNSPKANLDPHSTSNVSVATSLEKANRSTKEKPSGSSSPKVLTPNTQLIENCVKREIDDSPLNACTSVNSTQLDRTSAAKSIYPTKYSSNPKFNKANPVPHSTSNISVSSSSEKANILTKEKSSDLSSPKVLTPNTQLIEKCMERNTDSSPLNSCKSVNSTLLDKITTAKSINHPKNSSNTNSLSGGIVTTVPVTALSETSFQCSLSTTVSKGAVPSAIPHKAQVSESATKALRKSTELPIKQLEGPKKIIDKDENTSSLAKNVESTLAASVRKDLKVVSDEMSSVTENSSLNFFKSSSKAQDTYSASNEKERKVALSNTFLENSADRKESQIGATQSSQSNKNVLGKMLSDSIIKATSDQSPGNDLLSSVASHENVSSNTESYSEISSNHSVETNLVKTSAEISLSSISTSEKQSNSSKISGSKILPKTSEVSKVSLTSSGRALKDSSRPQELKATDKLKNTNLSSPNQNAQDGTVVSTSQTRTYTETNRSDSFTKLGQRKGVVGPTCQESLNDSSTSVAMKKSSSSIKEVSKASVENTEPSRRERHNKSSSVLALVSPASIADPSLKAPSSEKPTGDQPLSTNVATESKKSFSAVISSEKCNPSNVAPKPAPSSVAAMRQTKAGSSPNLSTIAKIPAPTCIVHPTTVHTTDMSTPEAIRSEVHGSLQSNSVPSSVLQGCAKSTMTAAKGSESGSAPVDVARKASTTVYTNSTPLKIASHNQGIPTAVVTPKINLQKFSSTTKSSQTKCDVSVDKENPSNQRNYGIILLNIHRRIKDEDLKMLFEACGPVHSMLRPINIIGKPADYSWAKFLSQDDALRAKRVFSAVKLEGNPISVKMMGVYTQDSNDNVLQADKALYKKLGQVAMKCKFNLSLKAEMAIQYADPREGLASDQVPVPSKENPSQRNHLRDKEDWSQGNHAQDKDDDDISLSSVSLSSLEDLCTGRDKVTSENSKKNNLKACKAKADGNLENQEVKGTSADSLIRKPSTSSTPQVDDQGISSWKRDVCKRLSEKHMLGVVAPCMTNSTEESSSSLSNKEIVMDETLVKVSNLSDLVPGEMVDRLFLASGALENGKSEGSSGAKIFRFPTFRSALLAEGQLKGLRLLDKKLTVKVVRNKSGDKPALSLDEEMKIRNNILLVLGDYENLMVNAAKVIAESGVNAYSFKTQLCTKQNCSSQQLCHDYHSAEDKRRNPLLYNYSTVMCCMVQNKKECNRHEECEDAHSTIEILFHNTRFRSNNCIGWSHLKACPMVDKVCPFAHPDSPDFFFHPKWENLYVEGLHNTLLFLSGAILNYFRLLLPDSQNEIDHSAHPSILHVRILVITPTADMVKLYVEAVKELALTCNLKVAAVTLDSVTQDASVLVGTPASLSKLLVNEKRRPTKDNRAKVTKMVSNVKAIIIDDVQSVLKEFSHVSSHQALKELLSSQGINKVAVSEDIEVIEVHKASRLFSSKVAELPMKKQAYSGTVEVCKKVFESSSQKIPIRTFSPVQVQACEKDTFTSPQNQPLTKSKSGTTPVADQEHSLGVLDDIPPLSPVSDTETVLYTSGRSPSCSMTPWSPLSESPSLSDFQSEKSLDMPLKRSPAKRKRKSSSSRNEGSSASCGKRLRSSYHTRQLSPSTSSSKDYSSHSASPNYYENFERSSSQRDDSQSSSRKRKLPKRSHEDEEESPPSEYSTRRPSSSASRSHRSPSPKREKSSRHARRSSDQVSSREQGRSSKRSPKRRERSSRHRSRSKGRSHRHRSDSSEQSPKRHHSHHSRHRHHKHNSRSKRSKKGHKCKKHSSKQYLSSSEKKRTTPLSNILVEGVIGDLEGDERERLPDGVAESSQQVEKPGTPFEKQNASNEAEETDSSKDVPDVAIDITEQEEESTMLDKVPSWDEVTSHVKQVNSAILTSKGGPSSKPKMPPKDVSTLSTVSLCEICRVEFDPESHEEFLKVENALKQKHSEYYQVFLDSPEVHPDYEISYEKFEQYYRQRYGNQGTKEMQETMWNLFWEELVHDEEKEEWMVKREGLLKQFEVNRKQDCKCASQGKVEVLVLSESDSDSSDVIIVEDETPSSSKCIPSGSTGSRITNQSSSSNSKDRINNPQAPTSSTEKVDSPRVMSIPIDKDQDFSLTESLHILGEVCETLFGDFFGSLMKKVIGRVRGFSNTREAFMYLGEGDTIKLLEMSAIKIKEASATAEGAQKGKLLYCSVLVKKLIDHASGNSTCAKINITQIAKATMNKETSVVLGVIRETLKEYGIRDPSLETIRQVYSEVSSLNLKTALGNI